MEMDKKMNQKTINQLKRIGLNEYESKAFVTLLEEGTATAGEISKKSEIPRPRTYDVLDKLEEKGLCSIQPGRPTKYKSHPIEEAMENLKKSKEKEYKKEVKKIKEVKEKLEEELQRTKEYKEEKKSPHDFLWFLKDKEKMRSKIKRLLSEAENEVVLATDSEDALEHLEEYEKELQQARERGTNVKIITDSADKLDRVMKFAEIQERDHKHRVMTVDDHSILFLTPKEEKDIEVGAWVKSPFFTEGIKHKLEE